MFFFHTGVSLLVTGAEPPAAAEARPLPVPPRRLPVVTGQGYFPVALRLKDGRIAVVLRGGAEHVGIKGRLDIVFSSDEGETWSSPTVVVDSPVDDRNPAFGQAADGTLVVGFWRTATYDETGKYNPNLDKPRNTWVTRSKDGGRTWSEPAEIDVRDIGWGSPFGKILTLPDGAMLMAIYGGPVREPGTPEKGRSDASYLYRSTDNGATWRRFSQIAPGHGQFNETALLQLPSGEILAAMRSRAGAVWLTRSGDGGLTWSEPKRVTPDGVHPADLCQLADGRLLLVVGNRIGPLGVSGMVAAPGEEFDWERHFTLVDDAISRDCGYPSSVLLKDGRALTVYYATRVRQHPEWGVHCGALLYKVP